jgi:hypothetical protein
MDSLASIFSLFCQIAKMTGVENQASLFENTNLLPVQEPLRAGWELQQDW